MRLLSTDLGRHTAFVHVSEGATQLHEDVEEGINMTYLYFSRKEKESPLGVHCVRRWMKGKILEGRRSGNRVLTRRGPRIGGGGRNRCCGHPATSQPRRKQQVRRCGADYRETESASKCEKIKIESVEPCYCIYACATASTDGILVPRCTDGDC